MFFWFLSLVVAPVAAVGWLLYGMLFTSLAKMTHGERQRRGEPRRSSGWGSAQVNGAYFRGGLKIEAYDDGVLLRSAWITGGGELWLPRDAILAGQDLPGTFLRPRGYAMVSGGHRVTLYGRLVDFVRAQS
jgi:hypothetical protein